MLMRSIVVFIAAFSHVLIVSYALPQFSVQPFFGNATLRSVSESVCICSSTSPGCADCSTICCIAGEICDTISGKPFSEDMCCEGDGCVGVSVLSSSTSSSISSTQSVSSATSTNSVSSSPTTTSTPSPSLSSTPSVSSSPMLTTSSLTSATLTASTPLAPPSITTPPAVRLQGLSGAKIGSIVGGTVAGVVAIAIMTIMNAAHIKYLLGVLASALFGFFILKSRRLVFSIDDNIGPTQISLFLTSRKRISDDSDDEFTTILVWKVFDIGNAQNRIQVDVNNEEKIVPERNEEEIVPERSEEEIFPEHASTHTTEGQREDSALLPNKEGVSAQAEGKKIDLTIPSTYGKGVPKIGFATIRDRVRSVKCIDYGPAPTILNAEGTWEPDSKARRRMPLVTIANRTTDRIAIGTIDNDESFNPFLLVQRAAFRNSRYQAEDDLYLHVFRSNGYIAGMYGPDLIHNIRGDNLSCDGDGIKVKDLRPLTSWRISSAGNNRLKVEISANQKDDIKKFKHDMVIKPNARA